MITMTPPVSVAHSMTTKGIYLVLWYIPDNMEDEDFDNATATTGNTQLKNFNSCMLNEYYNKITQGKVSKPTQKVEMSLSLLMLRR